MRRLFAYLSLLIIFHTPPVFASVIINEVSPRTNPEWVELYNSDPNPVDLTGWYFKDASGTKKLISNPETFAANTYYLATGYSSWLNNTGQELLYLFNNSDVMVDSLSFEETKENTSLARVPDITGSWLLDQIPTPLSSNNQPTPTPTPAPSPTDAASPIPSPTPTPTPSPLPSTLASAQKPSPSPTPSPSPSPTPVPSSKPAPSPSISDTLFNNNAGTVAGEATIDLSAYGNIPSPTPLAGNETNEKGLTLNKSRAKNIAYLGTGIALLAVATYLWFRRKNEGIIN